MATGGMNMPASLPLYPEMIYAALDALNEKMGSNKTSISKFIESKYRNLLPPSHSILLRHHLNKMKDNGELIFWKNNYMKPNPNFIRRGRGRPPKSSSSTTSNGITSPASSTPCPVFGGAVKSSGRPGKDISDVYDAVTVPLADVDNDGGGGVKEKSGRGRGRPRKLPKVDDVVGGVTTGTARPSGRPPNVKLQTAADAGHDVGSSE